MVPAASRLSSAGGCLQQGATRRGLRADDERRAGSDDRGVIEINESLVVDRPVEAVYAHLAQIEALPSWLPSIRSAQRLDPGEPRVGSRARIVIAGPGTDIRATGEVTALVPPTSVAFRTLDAPARIVARCELMPRGTGSTELRLAATVELPGLLRFGEGMVRDRIRRELPTALHELRTRLEQAIPA